MKKIRRFFTFVLGIATMIFGVIAFSGCDQIDKIKASISDAITWYEYSDLPVLDLDHKEHDWGEWEETAPTCTEAGRRVRSCKGCIKKQQEEIEPLGHNLSRYFPDNNGDCLTEGTMTAKCYRCGEKKVQVDPNSAQGHVFNKYRAEQKYFASAGTCTTSARYYYSCECGEKGEETFESGEYAAHVYNQRIAYKEYLASDATCSAKAKYYFSCECGAKGTSTFETGVTLPHVEEKVLFEEPTCSKAGSYKIVCSECSKTVRLEAIPATNEHSYTHKVEEEYYVATKDEITGEATYYYSCECGKKGTEIFIPDPEPEEPTIE